MKIFFVILIGVVGSISLRPPYATHNPDLQPKVIPPKGLVYLTFGFDELMADNLWLRLIQNFDYCENPRNLVQASSQETRDDVLDHLEDRVGKSRCRKSWVYHMLDRITDLSPQFLMAYTMGASTLSVVVDDIEGASLIYEKGLKAFPKNWVLAYRAAYHELYERNRVEKAAMLLEKAGRHGASEGAPPWISHLSAKLYERNGQVELGRRVLVDFLARPFGDEKLRKKARKRLEKLNHLRK